MIYLQLYWVFFQIGALAFGGGYATIPLIQSLVVEQHGWLSVTEMTDLVAISQMTPGPIAVNAATFVGTKVAFIPGSIVATLGLITPSTILMLSLARILFSNRKLTLLDRALKGLRPGVIALIAIASISMFTASVLTPADGLPIDPIALVTCVLGLVLFLRKVDVIKIIGASAGIGILMAALLQFLSGSATFFIFR